MTGACLVQLVLPVRDNAGKEFPGKVWEELKTRLAGKFGGVTAFRRAPAEGVWAPADERRTAEDVFIVEVMTPALDKAWWAALQIELERTLRQDHVIIRAIPVTEIDHPR
jgi:hypothetical protein